MFNRDMGFKHALLSVTLQQFEPSNISSIGILKSLAALNASGKLGSNFPFSIALIV
jgi:hypothetical protein